ncbi:MAG: PKD domain-containing protein [Bacteroidota bacterium]
MSTPNAAVLLPALTYCPDDTLINIVAPYGYQNYTWFNNSFTQTLGNQQILTLKPPPPAGTTLAVELLPYSGYGCPDTLYARLVDTLTVTAHAGADIPSCNYNPVPIGIPPKPGLVYSWSPAAGLTNPNISNPYAAPDVTTTYVLTVNHDGGGCIDTDTVVVRAAIIDKSLELIGKDNYCIGSGDSAILRVHPTDSIQWYREDAAIAGATETEYRVTQTGTYYALLFNDIGCSIATERQPITISTVPVPGIANGITSQCLVGNRFVFTNTSTNDIGAMQYNWILGDGTTARTRDVVHTYTQAGVYEVKMVVNSSSVCADSVSSVITVFQNAIADFDANPVCINLPMQAVNKRWIHSVRPSIMYGTLVITRYPLTAIRPCRSILQPALTRSVYL